MTYHSPQSPLSNVPGGNSRLLKFSVSCPVCEHAYDLQALRIVGESDQSLLTHIVCGRCSTAVLTLVAVKQSGVVATRTVIDLMPEEIPMLEDRHVHEDEILDFYSQLEEDTLRPYHFV
ncbi:MAG: hypothetical protein WCV86_04745 [Patescibacteria group bacterium]|jgi:hypothetical protein